MSKSMELDFSKICRVCLNEGVMMSIFKVNVSKKMMACASVQVWPNDSLPTQICNKCSAKLHISFQFKKQCEKNDAKLRQYLANNEHNRGQQQHTQEQNEPIEQIPQVAQVNVTQSQQINSGDSCVFIECAPMIDMPQQSDKFVHFGNVPHPQDHLTQINYNLQTDNHINYNLQNIASVQVYNGTYSIPVQEIQTTNVIQNQVLATPIHMQNAQIIQHQPMIETQHVVVTEDKDKLKRGTKMKKDENDGETGKQCLTCNKVFPTAIKLTRHMKTHSSDMPYKCNVCNKAFSHSGNYKIHLRMHTDERPFRCTVCDKGCRQAQDLEKHMRTHTGERPHRCTLCTKAFSTSSNLIAHIRIHTGEKPYVCCVCQKAFCQSNELTKHMRTHTGEKSHICDICHKGFNGSSTLIVHRRSHTGERPYVCHICNKAFAQSSCLSVHMKRHNGQKNFVCSVCEKPFLTAADMREHYLTHSGDKPFGCNVCDKRFIRANDLNRHMKTHAV